MPRRRGRPKLYDSPRQGSRVFAAARRLLADPTDAIKVAGGEVDAKLIVEYLARNNDVAAVAEKTLKRGVWIVRIEKESE